MLSSLIGTRLAIQPKIKDDWTIVPNLWEAVIGDPSSMKTPSTSEVFKPLNRLALSAHKEFEDDLQVYEIETIKYEAQKKAHITQVQDQYKGKKVDNIVSYPDPPRKPQERRLRWS